eukprot:gene13972-16515_t
MELSDLSCQKAPQEKLAVDGRFNFLAQQSDEEDGSLLRPGRIAAADIPEASALVASTDSGDEDAVSEEVLVAMSVFVSICLLGTTAYVVYRVYIKYNANREEEVDSDEEEMKNRPLAAIAGKGRALQCEMDKQIANLMIPAGGSSQSKRSKMLTGPTCALNLISKLLNAQASGHSHAT